MTFKVNTTDCSANIIAGTYKVNNEPVYKEWEDGNHTTHKKKLRDKVVGTLDMFFRSTADYSSFLTTLASATADEKTTLTVSVNNTQSEKTGFFFVTHDAVRDIDGTWTDYIDKFTLNITEA